MTAYDKIYDIAIGNYGIITSAEAKAIGIRNTTLVQLAARNRLERLGYGVYRIDKYVPHADGLDVYACAIARVGREAYLWGPSVLALHHLCPTNPTRIYVASPLRCRAKLPQGIVLKKGCPSDRVEHYEGLAVQTVADAILASQHLIMLDRLLDAVQQGLAHGLLTDAEAKGLVKELYKND